MVKKKVIAGLGILSSSLIFACPAFSQDSSSINLDPIVDKWQSSGHADADAEAFSHWDEDGEISTGCARCHSSPGYRDYLGDDGTAAGAVDNAAPIGTVVNCYTCHNETAAFLDEVTFPSGETITDLGPEARCMVCHQGRESGPDVEADIEASGVTGDDEVSDDLGFINIHYFATGATLYGAEAHGYYQYDGKVYDHKFDHAEGYTACVDCHDVHSLEIKVGECNDCHTGVNSVNDLHDIRMAGSRMDYDGDGNTAEGVAGEIATLQARLYIAIKRYTASVLNNPIIYDPQSYPYWFVDTNGNGRVDSGESAFSNQYDSWTARLVKATFNYQASQKDPGAFAHNAKYVIEILYDSIEDLNEALDSSNRINLNRLSRGDGPHFDGSKEAHRHWDEDGEVSARCSKCHGLNGLSEFLEHGNIRATEFRTDGMACTNCHAVDSDDQPVFTEIRDTGSSVTFPSGDQVSLNNDSQLCMNCHQGRQSGESVEAGDFSNIHYFPAAAVFFGSEVTAGFEYPGKTYAGQNMFPAHPTSLSTCTGCHIQTDDQAKHVFTPQLFVCEWCHGESNSFETLGGSPRAQHNVITALGNQLLTEIQSYAAANGMTAVQLDGYPYWDGTETWDETLASAAYNYQVFLKEPCGYIHNGTYMGQILYDSVEALGGTPVESRPSGN